MPAIKCLFALVVAFAASLYASAQSRTETFTVQSELLGCEKTCSVYLPDGYDDSARAYPVLYLLHGASGDHRDWICKGNMQLIADETIAQGLALPMIVVMPDASADGETGAATHEGYFDLPGWEYARFFIEEFMPAVEKRYRIRPAKQHRAIAGLSMGGCGTLLYAQHHPDLFGSACPLSALIHVESPRWRNRDYVEAFLKNNALEFLKTMTDEQAAKLCTVRWWVDCGDDDFLWEGNIRFYESMRKRGIQTLSLSRSTARPHTSTCPESAFQSIERFHARLSAS